MPKNGKFFNSASDNEEWLPIVIESAFNNPAELVADELINIYNNRNKLEKDVYFDFDIKLNMDNSDYVLSSMIGTNLGIISSLYKVGEDEDYKMLLLLKGSVLSLDDTNAYSAEASEKLNHLFNSEAEAKGEVINDKSSNVIIGVKDVIMNGSFIVFNELSSKQQPNNSDISDSGLKFTTVNGVHDLYINKKFSFTPRIHNINIIDNDGSEIAVD